MNRRNFVKLVCQILSSFWLFKRFSQPSNKEIYGTIPSLIGPEMEKDPYVQAAQRGKTIFCASDVSYYAKRLLHSETWSRTIITLDNRKFHALKTCDGGQILFPV